MAVGVDVGFEEVVRDHDDPGGEEHYGRSRGADLQQR